MSLSGIKPSERDERFRVIATVFQKTHFAEIYSSNTSDAVEKDSNWKRWFSINLLTMITSPKKPQSHAITLSFDQCRGPVEHILNVAEQSY